MAVNSVTIPKKVLSIICEAAKKENQVFDFTLTHQGTKYHALVFSDHVTLTIYDV